MTKKLWKKTSVILLVLAMVVSMIPQFAFAAGIEGDTADLTVNSSKVAFAGHTWWVIGDKNSGVYPQENHITLLAAKNDFGESAFREGAENEFKDSTPYEYEEDTFYYYANNPGEMSLWATPNEYAGSTLQRKMEEIADKFSEDEQAVITARDLAGDDSWEEWKEAGGNQADLQDGIVGQGVAGQKLWALSETERETIGENEVRAFGSSWWLRSPFYLYGWHARIGISSGDYVYNLTVYYVGKAVRPALSLHLASVLFTSDATAGSGKSLATAGSDLTAAEAITADRPVKFTMKSENQKLKVLGTTEQSTQTGETLSFSYSGATTGENQYVSCILKNGSDEVKYYGKLKDSSNAASGELSIPLEGVSEGEYTLAIFSEQANGALFTDFCSEPVTMKVNVDDNGEGSVSDFVGTIHDEHTFDQEVVHDDYKASEANCTTPATYYKSCECGKAGTETFTSGDPKNHAWSTAWAKDDTHHWHECGNTNCPVTDNSQKNGYDEHSCTQQKEEEAYKASDATCTELAEYYKSCICGVKGTETFTVGKANGHTWGDWINSGNGQQTRTCSFCGATESKSVGGGSGGSFIYYDISTLPTEHGTIELSRDSIYKYGSVDVALTPEEGYEVKDLLINGESVGAVSQYTIKDITEDMEVSAVFAETEAHKNARLKEGVENTEIKAWSERTKNGIRVYFKKSYGFKVDGYEFYRSTKKGTFSKKPYYVSKKGTARYLNNTKNIKKGTHYYYKIRGYRTIGGEKVYTKWSNVANRTAK